MPATRCDVEDELVVRVGGWLKAALLTADPARDPAPRAYLNPAIRSALAFVGVAPASPFLVGDADVALVPDPALDRLLDFAHYKAVETCLGNLGREAVTKSLGSASISLSDLVGRMKEELARLREDLEKKYGPALTTSAKMASGVIPLPPMPRPPTPAYPAVWGYPDTCDGVTPRPPWWP
jgi:hypothetical protein